MYGRPHSARLLYDLNGVREELLSEARRFKSDEFDWTPAPGMRSCKALLQEIGTMEKVCVHLARNGETLDWGTITEELEAKSESISTLLSALEEIREETRAYLNAVTEEELETPIALPKSWQQYFDSPAVEPEELVRWVCRNEYYHLGQLIIYRWTLGDNPYVRD